MTSSRPAQGGPGDASSGGLGAVIGGTVSLTAGTQLEIVVGGAGLTGNFGTLWGGGGGGGSFVFVSGAAPAPHRRRRRRRCRLRWPECAWRQRSNRHGRAGRFRPWRRPWWYRRLRRWWRHWQWWHLQRRRRRRLVRQWRQWPRQWPIFGRRRLGWRRLWPTDFRGWPRRWRHNLPPIQYANGGFGGGGGGGWQGGGGGGGYSGGGGGDGIDYAGGGGGSFIAAEFTNTSLTGGANSGDGYVIISSVPEPSSLILLASGIFVLAGYGWRQRTKTRGHADSAG